MTIPEAPRAQAVARALTGAILVCRQYLREPDGAGLQADLAYMMPILEWFTEVLGAKVPSTRVEAIEGVLSLMLAKGESGSREPDVGIDLRQVSKDLGKEE
jgi:hypothetical protein